MTDLAAKFMEKACLVSASVCCVPSLDAAFDKTMEICREKAPLDPQMGAKMLRDKQARIVAAPNLEDKAFGVLSDKCLAQGNITLIREGLREYPGGIDMGISLVDFGIAETGTLVLDSASEETRLSTMFSESHVAILYCSKLRESALEMTEELSRMVRDPGSYTAFITGASRTADIERILAIGVHGPLELHILLVED